MSDRGGKPDLLALRSSHLSIGLYMDISWRLSAPQRATNAVCCSSQMSCAERLQSSVAHRERLSDTRFLRLRYLELGPKYSSRF